ncbi:MAG TPA: ASCH domain-containing protein [Candidatus Angelobacter sp.]|nr:ASCH domain-containing protein [Candidatus Angelobacter sp.]
MPETIKCLTLWEPWASAMAKGLKHVETRPWYTHYRGPLAIHAAKKRFNPNKYSPEFAHLCRKVNFWPDNLAYGRLLCIVDLIACHRTEAFVPLADEKPWGNYENGRFAWVTNNLRVLPIPLQVTGRQGLFNWQVPILLEDLLSERKAEDKS